jgi:hypothetical protein
MSWGLPVEIERRNRILLSLYAYSYEYQNDSLVSDGEFDALCGKIDTSIDTGNELLDTFFRAEFSPDTGMWIHKHPERDKLENMYQALKSGKWTTYRLKNRT